MRKLKLAVALTGAFALFGAPAAFASPIGNEFGPELVVNGGFETGDFTGWTQTPPPSGNLGFAQVSADPPAGSSLPVGGVAYIGIYGVYGGPVGSLGFISQNIVTIVGASYNIQFWLASSGATPNEFRVEWGDATVFDRVDNGRFAYTEFIIDPVATSTLTTLTIGFRNDPGFDYFDDISVRQTTQVPEPFTLALLGIGLAGLGFSRRKIA